MMLRKHYFFFLLAIVSLCYTMCQNYEFPESPYPRFEIKPAIEVTDNGVKFQTILVKLPKSTIVDHGFIWSQNENQLIITNVENKISLGALSSPNAPYIFNGEVTSRLTKDKIYYVRSFIQTSDYVMYSNTISFYSLGTKGPLLEDFNPKVVDLGDTIEITGSEFGISTTNVEVLIGSIKARIITISNSKLTVIVPAQIEAEESLLSVSTNKNQSVFSDKLVLKKPRIISFFPETMKLTDTLYINGENFDAKNLKIYLSLGRAYMESVIPISRTKNTITIVPSTIPFNPNAFIVIKVNNFEVRSNNAISFIE